MRHAPAERRRARLTDAAKGRFESHQAAQAGRDADRAAAVRADGDGAEARGHGDCGAAGAAAGIVTGRIRVARGAVVRIGAVGVDADLMHVGLADQQRAGRAQARHHRGIGQRRAASQEGRADGGWVGRLIHLVLDRHRHAVEQAQGLAGRQACARGLGLGQDVSRIAGDERAQRRIAGVAGLDGVKHPLSYGRGRGAARAVGLSNIARGDEHRAGGVGAERFFHGGWRQGGRGRCLGPRQRVERRRFFQVEGMKTVKTALLEQVGHECGAGDRVCQGARKGAQRSAGQLGQIQRMEIIFIHGSSLLAGELIFCRPCLCVDGQRHARLSIVYHRRMRNDETTRRQKIAYA